MNPFGRPKSDERERFLSKVRRVDGGCHEWQSTVDRGGYGKFYRNGEQTKAHRAAYELFVQEIPEGFCVLHRCDNRRCVNPDHLFLGTQLDNVRDMDAKGRRGVRSSTLQLQGAF